MDRGAPPSLIPHDVIVQDHGEGGQRALHVPCFTDSLRATWITRLLDPAPQPWKNILWSMLDDAYGGLGQGERLLVSAMTFDDLPGDTGMPRVFVHALKAWGRLPTPQPMSETPRYEVLMKSPLLFNSAATHDGYTPTQQKHVTYKRQLGATAESMAIRRAQQNHGRMVAGWGFRLIEDIMPFLSITRAPRARSVQSVTPGIKNARDLSPGSGS